jgi:sigma-E factor negative regulatory protein RseC
LYITIFLFTKKVEKTMSRFGTIIETQEKRATIKTSRRGVCESCAEKDNCSFDSALGKDVPEELFAINELGAQKGDRVEFDLPGHSELKISLLVWAVPLIGLLTGGTIGALYCDLIGLSADPATFLGAVAGLLLFIFPVAIYDRKVGKDPRITPHITKIISGASCPGTSEDV